MLSKSKKITITVLLLFSVFCFLLLLPSIRLNILHVIEILFNKKFDNPQQWFNLLFISSIISLILAGISIFILPKDEILFLGNTPNTFFSKNSLNLFKINNYNKKYYPAYILLLIVLIILRIITISNKSSLYIDETYSYIIANYNTYGLTEQFKNGEIKTGAEYKELMTCNDPSVKGAISDIIHLNKYTRDVPHTHFYYSLLRLWCIGHKTGDLKKLIWIGTSLNLILLCVSYYLLFLLVKKLFSNDFICLLVLFTAYTNTASISNSIYIRPYVLQEVLFILVANLFVSILNFEKKEIAYQNIPNMLKISLILALTFLTGYYSPIFIFIMALIILFITLQKKNYKCIKFWAFVVFFTLLFTLIFYPRYFYQLFFSRDMVMVKNVYSLNGVIQFLTHYFFYIPLIIVSISSAFLVLLQSRKNTNTKKLDENEIILLLVFISAFLWAITAFFLSPRKTIHHSMAAFPLFSLLIGFIANKLPKTIYKSIFSIALIFIFSFGIVLPLNKCYLYSNIEYLDYNPDRFSTFTQNKESKVCIINNPYWRYSEKWVTILLYADYLEYIDNEQLYFFSDSLNQISKMIDSNEDFYILIETDLLYDAKFNKLISFDSEQVFSYSIFHFDSIATFNKIFQQ